jgi:hypothetical protein
MHTTCAATAWGDDAGFLRFQRFSVGGFKATERELLVAERYQ